MGDFVAALIYQATGRQRLDDGWLTGVPERLDDGVTRTGCFSELAGALSFGRPLQFSVAPGLAASH